MLEVIVASGLNATEFDLVPESGDRVRIAHISTGSYFTPTRHSHAQFSVQFKVGDYRPRSALYIAWDSLLKYCDTWARDLKEDIETPDLWAAVRSTREFLSEPKSAAVASTLFTQAEQAEISTQIQEIKNYIRNNLSITNDQLSDIEAQLDEADEAASRINRKDWLLLFMGVMFTLIITGLIPSSAVQQIFEMTLHGLGHLFIVHGGPLRLPPSTV